MTGPPRCLNLFLFVVVYIWNTDVMGNPLPYNEPFQFGYTRTAPDKAHASVFGQHSDDGKNKYEQQVGFVNAGVEKGFSYTTAQLHTGVYRMTGTTKDIFGENTADSNSAIDFLTAGLEVGNGAMGRARIADATVSVGPGELNRGVGFDTGLISKDGIEAKFLGVGGGITSKGMHVCFILCLGFNWG